MFDFRYHALSLVAVFLALAIGILLGATIGNSLVSDADKGIRSSLHSDVLNARNAASQAQSQLSQRDKIISSALPMLVQGELSGQRVAIVATGSLPGSVESDVRQTVETAGGTVSSVSTFDVPSQLDAIEQAAGVRGRNPTAIQGFARRVVRSIVNGTGVAVRMHRSLPDAMRGDFHGAGLVVYYRSPPPDQESDSDKALREGFENGLADGLKSEGVQTVGVEQQSTDPSQVGWYKDHGMSSVDSVDLPGGQIALVFVLTGQKGAYGVKGGAQPLPKLPIGSG
ncbi:MAG TPA: copper transporter [Thermoleophilaceae bacterium]|nr:copper transporter [Thermoleophilaceae bacterium]